MSRTRKQKAALGGLLGTASLVLFLGVAATPLTPPKSINSTSQNRHTSPITQVPEQQPRRLVDYRLLAVNDLGMHCGDFDQRGISLLPPFNVLHAQVIKRGATPRLLDQSEVTVLYSAGSNPRDPALAQPVPSTVYKTNFWDINLRTGNPIAFDAYDTHYPPGVLT
jgi:hypothetical protein